MVPENYARARQENRMHRIGRRILKGFTWVAVAIVLLLALQVSILAFPSPWFDGSVRKANLSLYYTGATRAEMEALVDDVLGRVRTAEVYREDVQLRVFICPSQGLFNLFARLSRVPTSVPGFNLSLLNNSFVSVPRLEQRRLSNRGRMTHSARDGELASSIAHELIHDYVRERIGYREHSRIPRWKSEGYAEYAANRTAVRKDSRAALARRVEILQTELVDARARDYYEAGLIVEFLAEKRGYTFAEIMAGEVTRETARPQLLAWYDAQR